MKKFSFGVVALLTLFLLACSEKETPGGIKYTVLKKGDGVELPSGKFMVVDLRLTNSKDSILMDTKDMGYPAVLPIPDQSMAKDIGEYGVFKSLSKGDCVRFKVPAAIVFSKTRRVAVPKEIDPKSDITFLANVRDVWEESQVQKFQTDMMKNGLRKQKTADSLVIAEHLQKNALEALSTPSGIRYIIKKEGVGEPARSGQIAYVQYAGYTVDGKLFDTSLSSVAKANNLNNGASDQPYPVVVNTRGVIAGWDEILQLMNKGMKVRVYIPSELGYGPSGNPPIPPNAVLIFDMEVTNIK
jgi:FKBP-type peptidyl-prolyl cis-trans isomerase FkpA